MPAAASDSRPEPSPPAARRRGRLTRSADFDAVHQLGRAVGGRHLTVRWRVRGEGEPRVGYAVPRAVGNAVERNAVKRRLREAAREHEALLRPGTDYVLIARPGLRPALEAQGTRWLGERVAELLRLAGEGSV